MSIHIQTVEYACDIHFVIINHHQFSRNTSTAGRRVTRKISITTSLALRIPTTFASSSVYLVDDLPTMAF